MKRKYVLWALVIIAAMMVGLIIWAGMQNKVQPNPAQKVSVKIAGLKGPTSIGMINLFEQKPSLGQNFESAYEVVPTPDAMVSKLLKKELDLAALPTNVAAKLYNKSPDYKLAAITSWGVLYILNTDGSVKSWTDLKGKTIYISDKGSTPDVMFRYLAKQNGLDPEKDVAINYTLPATEIAQSMAGGKTNLALIPEPFVTVVQVQNKNAKIAINIQDEWKKIKGESSPFAMTCLVVKSEFASKYPDAVNKFLTEYKASIDWVNANPISAGALVEKNGIIDKAKIAEISIPRCNLKYQDAISAKTAVIDFLKVIFDFSPQDIGGKMPDENFYYKK